MEINFDNNNKLLILLPIIYNIWEDNILTEKEFTAISNYIKGAKWLTEDEKVFIASKIKFSDPPTRSELNNWLNKINSVASNSANTLTELGILMANNDRVIFTGDDIQKIAPDIVKLEISLGISGPEATQRFLNNQNSITNTHNTNQSFNVGLMTSLLNNGQDDLINKVKLIIKSADFELNIPTDTAEFREKVLQWCKILSENGLGSYAYPKEYGGKGDINGYFTIMETLSYHDLSLVIKFGVQFGLWGMSVLSLGTEKHYSKYLNDIGLLNIPGCFAMTETHHGSNVKGIKTTATYNHINRSFTIHTPEKYDRKEYIGNAANHGEMATVFAKLIIDDKDYGVNAFIVPIRNKAKQTLPGIAIEDCGHKMGLNGVDNGIIYFDNVEIPYDNMLDKFASVNTNGEFESRIPSDNRRFFTMLGTLVGGRIGIPRSALSAAKVGLATAIKYGDKRRQFGPENGAEVPVLNYRMHQQRLMPYLANSYALTFGLQYLTNRFINRKEEEMQEIEALAAGLKAYATWNTRDTLQECREACGGKGYLSENRIDDLKNDTEIYTTFEGDNTVLMQLTAKNRLSEFRKQFGEMSVSTIFSYVVEQAKTSITEKNPFAIRNTDESHLKDAEFHLHAFQYREKEVVASAAKRFKRLIDSGLDAFDAANIMHPHMLQITYSYLDRVVLEQFKLKIDAEKDVALKEVLTRLYNLFALNKIDENKAWYLEQGYMDGIKTKAIRKLISQLCWEIRQDAVPLVQAFDIPESCLGKIASSKIEEA
ncbi:acyl-CoA oxidase [Flavobacterium akiainvivens]|uniref:acyl-CoA oxidase n=1 Tax=Flavobacterium akiainvivens TaxID=1202724 RepID=A0A0N0RQI7_9FLAO|nr:acyl-CoA dehydrogenase [Flavobacterium akiainvivens]KOS05230.1 acyl-CoA oxidase [Flavobacterium akiainvivens]SFQ50407.1 Acyl-coenzyme A oxidase [Flavobacterium akiainvivens]